MTIEENKTLVRRWLETRLEDASVAVDGFLAPGYVDHNPVPGVPADREGARRMYRMLREAMPDLRCHVDVMMAAADQVAVLLTWEGTHRGELMGIPATGRHATWTEMNVVRVDSGRIADVWGISNQMLLMQQLGVIPAPGSR
ncbi:ester cyclase [Pyxidicoccus caerfyrddinensis]|uniref:ester cyclase n=1 Tax=Pyxidicoccus caerfyrddinensis TaxID=2709663 RepID=UPI0013DACB91|nr:ester cyclase [Pyxidicoccus caerfyrddinensis]